MADKYRVEDLMMDVFRAIAVLVGLVGLPESASAQDYLEPARGVLTRSESQWDYERRLHETLLKDAATYHQARLLCQPNAGPEWMVTLVREDPGPDAPDAPATYHLDYVEAETQIFPEHDVRRVRLKRARVDLDHAMGQALASAWRAILREVRYPRDEGIGFHGTTYLFSRGVPLGPRLDPEFGFEEGRIWSPRKGTLTSGLVGLGEDLRRYALASDEDRAGIGRRLRADAEQLKVKAERRDAR